MDRAYRHGRRLHRDPVQRPLRRDDELRIQPVRGPVDLLRGRLRWRDPVFLRREDDVSTASATISGTITGAAATHPVRVLDGFVGSADVPARTTTYTLPTLVGPQRLFAEELVDMRPVKLATVDATVTDGEQVNFDLGAGFAPVTRALTASAATAAVSLYYRDAHGISRIDHATAPFNAFRAIPRDQLGSGLNRLLIDDTTGDLVIRCFKEPIDQQVTLPTPFGLAQQPTATAAPYPNVKFTVPVQAGATYDLFFSNTNSTTNIYCDWSVELTSA
jgi:hypothetical protein